MTVLNLLTFMEGLALFLYGIHLLSEGLEKLAGGRVKAVLYKITSHPWKGMLLGIGVTAMIQSSSAVTVMTVGFVDAGMIGLNQAAGIIMGANIGTTVTSWILSLAGDKGGNHFLLFLKPQYFVPVLAMAGVVFLMFCKKRRKKDVGGILLGFSILMFGMEVMSGALEPLRELPQFTRWFLAFRNPFLGMCAGALLTALIQSSSASVGILQALCAAGTIPYYAVLPVIMGQNIGTCITAVLSSIGTGKNARRTAFIHLYFNVIGTAFFMLSFYAINNFISFPFLQYNATAAGIALIHSGFNIFAAMVLFPFSRQLILLACISVPGQKRNVYHSIKSKLRFFWRIGKRKA